MEDILAQGAEAIIVRDGSLVFKKRIAKSYRQASLDTSLRTSRTKRERKALQKAAALGILVPQTHPSDDPFTLVLSFIEGKKLRDVLLATTGKHYLQILGEQIATLHDADIIHGDLTTSNILVNQEDQLVLIDFGLSFFSKKEEDKAVDIHLLEQALESTHYKNKEQLFSSFCAGYIKSPSSSAVLTRLELVRARGRHK